MSDTVNVTFYKTGEDDDYYTFSGEEGGMQVRKDETLEGVPFSELNSINITLLSVADARALGIHNEEE